MASNHIASTNLEKAAVAWGADMPGYIRLLASACDATNQRQVGDRLGKSNGYVSRIINRDYQGSYDEAETIVRAAFGNEDVICPLWGPIPLVSCLRSRRRKAPPQNHLHRAHAATCPTCPNNSDGAALAERDGGSGTRGALEVEGE